MNRDVAEQVRALRQIKAFARQAPLMGQDGHLAALLAIIGDLADTGIRYAHHRHQDDAS